MWVVSEYGHCDVKEPIAINRTLRQAGLLSARPGPFGEVFDTFESRAFAKAAQEFTAALRVCPQRDAILVSLGQTQFLLGEEEGAERTLLQAINSVAARYALGRIYYQQSRYVEAAAELERVVAAEPANYRAHDNLALCYDALQRDSDALRPERLAHGRTSGRPKSRAFIDFLRAQFPEQETSVLTAQDAGGRIIVP